MAHVLLVFLATHADLNDSLLRDISLLKKYRWKHTHLLLCSQSTHIYYYDPVTHRSHATRTSNTVTMAEWFELAAKWLATFAHRPTVTFLFSGHSNAFYLRPTATVYHSVAEVRRMIQRSFPKGFRFETMIFDSCAIASLEALYEFRHCTRYMMAAEGYLDDMGFLSMRMLQHIDRLADDESHVEKMHLLALMSTMYAHFPDQWNASLLCTDHVEEVVRALSDGSRTANVPFVYAGCHLVDVYAWYRDGRLRDLLRQHVIVAFVHNDKDPRHNHGLSITPGTTRWNGFADLYAESALWQDSAHVRKWHSEWDVDLRIMSVNLQFCDTIDKLEEWMTQWHESEADLLCVQEISTSCVTHLEKDDTVQLIHHNEEFGTAVLWLKQASDKRAPLPDCMWVQSIHLNDIPSIPHHRHRLAYEGNPPLETSMEDVLRLSKAARGPELESVLHAASVSNATHFLLAGDFNEPSHLDVGQRVAYPMSLMMEQDGWVDVMHAAHRAKPTWPAEGFFARHPSQRIDFVYLKGGWRVTHADRYLPRLPGWMSDHYALICDLTIKK